MICPHCNQPMPPSHGVVIDHLSIHRGAVSTHLTPRELRLFHVFIQRFTRTVTNASLIQSLYPIEADEPDGASTIVKVTVCTLRKKLSPLGLTVRNEWGVGYSLQNLVKERAVS